MSDCGVCHKLAPEETVKTMASDYHQGSEYATLIVH